MASLSVRNIEKSIVDKLRMRAAKHGISMEEEARRILKQAVTAPENLSGPFKKYFGRKNGIDLDLLNQRKPHNPMDLKK